MLLNAYFCQRAAVEPHSPTLDSQCRLDITLVALLPLELWIWTGKRSENPVSVVFPPRRVFFVLISHTGRA